MSDPVKTSDVEDVLFSIRRLVSDAPDVEETPKSEETSASSDALFLTSAHRVHDPATEPEQVDLEDMTTSLSHFRDAVSGSEEASEPMPSIDEMFADKEPERRLHLSEVVTETPEATDEYIEDVAEEEPRQWASDPDVDKLSDFATPEDNFGTSEEDADTAEETTAETVPEDWMSDEETALSSEFEESLQEDASEESASEAVEVADEHAVEDEDHAEFDDAPVEHDEIEEIVEDDAGDDVEDEAADVDEGEAADTEETSNVVDLSDFDETLVDEDALRDMVAEIVREELSGELGERITRNVRKLVRREIHRAMMARDFD